MIFGDEDATVPAIAGHHNEIGKMVQRFCGNGKICCSIGSHFGNLYRGPLMHVQRDVRVMLNKALDDRRQRIAGLGMGGGNRKAALLFFSKLLRYLTNTFDLK